MFKRSVFVALTVLCACAGGCDGKPAASNAQVNSESAKPELLKDPDYLKLLKKSQEHVETKKEYIASTKKVGGRSDAIYMKEFLKNPDKFSGTRLKILGKIMHIEEDHGNTVIQMYVTNNLDSVIVQIPESVKVYDGDFVTVYGAGAGTLEGHNRMGAMMAWPLIRAKYVVLKRHAEDG